MSWPVTAGTEVSGLTEFLVFLGFLWIEIPNLSQKDSSFDNFGHKNALFGHFGDFWPGNGPN